MSLYNYKILALRKRKRLNQEKYYCTDGLMYHLNFIHEQRKVEKETFIIQDTIIKEIFSGTMGPRLKFIGEYAFNNYLNIVD